MLTPHTLRRMQTGAIALVVLVGMAASADARVFRMTGNWEQNTSAQLKIPPIFGIDNAPGALVSATGSAPATLTIPGAAFTGEGPAGALTGFVFALPKTTLVQISTMFSFTGPGVGSTATLVSGTKTSRPANFSFCPGAAANPACSTPATGGNQGTQHGLIRYTAGPNHFGGTMQMLTGGTGSLTALIGTSPIRLQHNTIGGLASATVSMLPRVNGGPYSNQITIDLPAGPITTGGVCAGGPCGTNGVIVTPGVVTSTPTAGSTNTNVGFPWTTGVMFGIATEDLPTQPSTFTLTGSDSRTDLGLGNITLVSGGISHRFPADSVFIQADIITMSFKAQNLPSISPPGIAALAGLIMVGAGYAVTRRRK